MIRPFPPSCDAPALAVSGVGAYTPVVNLSRMGDKPPAAQAVQSGKRRRRPTTGKAHTERVAWGRDWGAKMSAFWKHQHALEAATAKMRGDA